jgi:flavodoxin
MTKLGIVYFSGTGNTAWVAQRLAEQLRVLGDATTAFSCEETPTAQLDVAAWDVLGIAFPVHSSFAAPVFRDYLEQLPPADNPCLPSPPPGTGPTIPPGTPPNPSRAGDTGSSCAPMC